MWLCNTFLYLQDENESFTADEIAVLQSIPGVINKDASFVKKALEMQYKNELSKLSERSVKGTAGGIRHVNGIPKLCLPKPPLTPKKVMAIRHQYNRRITQRVQDSTDFSKRIADVYFNKILNGVLSNFTRQIKWNQNAGVVEVMSV